LLEMRLLRLSARRNGLQIVHKSKYDLMQERLFKVTKIHR